ncbi:MAG TPA: hypothetical protein VKU41_02070 [Polyangiaceae bacterium]|nr:hypothetical protein [Polyangiaceae bacterium]
MEQTERQKLKEKMGEGARLDEAFTQSFLQEQIVLYFASGETYRARAVTEIEQADRRGEDILANEHVPGGRWLGKWPLAARSAALALWRTPHSS